jgi:hypothetical protein
MTDDYATGFSESAAALSILSVTLGLQILVIGRRQSRLPMAVDRALSPGHTRFLGIPFMCPTLRVSGLPATTGDLPLLVTSHGCKSAILFSHARIVRMNDSCG